jgi:hypothetical protein
MDIRAGYGLPEGLDPVELAAGLIARYENLWAELTREEVFSASEQYRIDSRIKRLNQLGVDVGELDVQAIDAGHRLRMRVQVVEPGHHRRRLEELTGLCDRILVMRQGANGGSFSSIDFAREPLLRAASDADAGVRIAAIRALCSFTPLPRLDPIRAALDDGDRRVRIAAIQAAGHFRDRQSLPVLAAAVKDTDAPVPADLKISNTAEPDTRYRVLLDCYKAVRQADPYNPVAPTHIVRSFEEDRQLPEARVKQMLQDVCSSPLLKEVAKLIERSKKRFGDRAS